MGKFDYIENVFSLKASIKKVTSHELGDICYSITYKEFVHRIYKELIKNHFLSWAKDMSKSFT